mgnify:CR=1 FL=1
MDSMRPIGTAEQLAARRMVAARLLALHKTNPEVAEAYRPSSLLQTSHNRRSAPPQNDRMGSLVERVSFAWERGKFTMLQAWDRC